MNRHVSVSFLKSVIFPDVMKIIPPDDNSPLHLHFLHDTSEDATTDRHVAGERAFLVNVGTFDSLENIKIQWSVSGAADTRTSSSTTSLLLALTVKPAKIVRADSRKEQGDLMLH